MDFNDIVFIFLGLTCVRFWNFLWFGIRTFRSLVFGPLDVRFLDFTFEVLDENLTRVSAALAVTFNQVGLLQLLK